MNLGLSPCAASEGSWGRCGARASPHPPPTQAHEQLHTSIRENPQGLAPLEQVCEPTVTSDGCHFAMGQPPVPGPRPVCIRSASWNKFQSVVHSSTQTTYNHPFLSQVLWGGTDGKKNEESDFTKCCRSPCNTACKMPCSLGCQPVINTGREGDQGCVQPKAELARSVMTKTLESFWTIDRSCDVGKSSCKATVFILVLLFSKSTNIAPRFLSLKVEPRISADSPYLFILQSQCFVVVYQHLPVKKWTACSENTLHFTLCPGKCGRASLA